MAKLLRGSLAGVLLFSACLLSAPVHGIQQGKPAWRWTVEERIAGRFDPEAMKVRAAEQDKERAWAKRVPVADSDPLFSIPAASDTPSKMSIEGKQTPELFLTWELFTSLLNRAFPPGGEFAEPLRRPIEERAVALGFGRDLWPRLEKVAQPLLKLEAEQERLPPSSPKDGYEMDARSIRICRARAEAIAAAEAEFGREAFLRLLYEAVAPDVRLDYFGVDSGLADHLRFLEEGCR